MIFNAERFYIDHRIEYITEGNKHCANGWLQIHCPFCEGAENWHLGYDTYGGYFNCWRCGFKNSTKVVAKLIRCDWEKARDIVKQYGGSSTVRPKDKHNRIGIKPFKLPTSCGPLKKSHKKYLLDRSFNPGRLIKTWDLMGTSYYGDYKFRIVAPIYYNQNMVSFQARDITNKSILKYKACEQSTEIIHHKYILYGVDLVPFETCVLVEGIADVWRLGPGAVCGFGIKMTEQQITLLYERYRRIYIMFDDEPEAQKQAKRIGNKLASIDCDVSIIDDFNGDPGEMSNTQAIKLMKKIFS
jgi:hypothetical protein